MLLAVILVMMHRLEVPVAEVVVSNGSSNSGDSIANEVIVPTPPGVDTTPPTSTSSSTSEGTTGSGSSASTTTTAETSETNTGNQNDDNNNNKGAESSYTREIYEKEMQNLMDQLLKPTHYFGRFQNDRYDAKGLTMLTKQQMEELKRQIEALIDAGIDGDVYDFGSWRGGTSILMAKVFTAYERLKRLEQAEQQQDIPTRQFWFFDSFDGFKDDLVRNDVLLQDLLLVGDDGDDDYWTAPLPNVRSVFVHFMPLEFVDNNVHFVEGMFQHVLPTFHAEKPIALLRLDSYLYDSTKLVLKHVYPAVAKGGQIIVDDYNWKPESWATQEELQKQDASFIRKVSKDAVDEYRSKHNIETEIKIESQRPSWTKETDADYAFPGTMINGEEYTREMYSEEMKELIARLLEPSGSFAKYHSTQFSKGLTMLTETMLKGLKRQVEAVVDAGIEGDVYEFGSWRGGASILMARVFTSYQRLRLKEDTPRRQFWLFDSFDGFSDKQLDNNDVLLLDLLKDDDYWKAPLENVKTAFINFTSTNFVDKHVHFVPGLFEDVVPKFPAKKQIAILRLDGYLYDSTKVVLRNLYPAVANGGQVIVGDYDWTPENVATKAQKERQDPSFERKTCKDAVDEYRSENGIETPITKTYVRPSWKKETGVDYDFTKAL